ncbi:hypothetical protein CgunFtcFv8_015923 [Champsocephalus gunnari]|nr:hypothetical protein CgunFtcFv8_015923 [Champsocephalus gunnari]
MLSGTIPLRHEDSVNHSRLKALIVTRTYCSHSVDLSMDILAAGWGVTNSSNLTNESVARRGMRGRMLLLYAGGPRGDFCSCNSPAE